MDFAGFINEEIVDFLPANIHFLEHEFSIESFLLKMKFKVFVGAI